MGWAELLTAAAFLAGWLLVTWGVASLTVWQVWPVSLGLLLISAGGWKVLAQLVAHGLHPVPGQPKKGGPK
jgi:hypothetical protein